MGQALRKNSRLYRVFEQAGDLLHFEKGRLIHFQGEEATCFYMVVSGELRSFLLTEDGRQTTLETLGPGKLFGQASYFGKVPRLTCAIAQSELHLLALDYERIQGYLASDPDLITELFDLMGYSIRLLTIRISSLVFQDAERRVAHALQQLWRHTMQDELSCTHQQLADLTGLNRVTVTRSLRKLAGYGWIEQGYRTIVLKDRAALQNFSNEGV